MEGFQQQHRKPQIYSYQCEKGFKQLRIYIYSPLKESSAVSISKMVTLDSIFLLVRLVFWFVCLWIFTLGPLKARGHNQNLKSVKCGWACTGSSVCLQHSVLCVAPRCRVGSLSMWLCILIMSLGWCRRDLCIMMYKEFYCCHLTVSVVWLGLLTFSAGEVEFPGKCNTVVLRWWVKNYRKWTINNKRND